MLLSDEEMMKFIVDNPDETLLEFARAIEAAILAKLAAKELPEPELFDGTCFKNGGCKYENGYTADQLHEAHAQGFAAGAAAQLSSEPVGFIDKCGEIFAQFEQMLSTDTPLYTRREAK